MNILKSLEWRYATKIFDTSKKIADADLQEILEALRLTASSFGLQPWKFVVITNPALREKLKEQAWGQPQVTDASHLIVLASRVDMPEAEVTRFIKSVAETQGTTPEDLSGYKDVISGAASRMTPEQVETWNAKQAYIALGNLLTVCALKEIDACPMEGFNKAAFDELLGLGAQYKVQAICPIGYRSTEDQSAGRAKVRYPMNEVIVEMK